MLKSAMLVCIGLCSIVTNAAALDPFVRGAVCQVDPGTSPSFYYAKHPPEQIALTVWFSPIETEVNSLKYRIEFSPNLTINSIITSHIWDTEEGSPVEDPGVSVSFSGCLVGWTWTHQFIITIEDGERGWVWLRDYNDEVTSVHVCNHPDQDVPIYLMDPFFYINWTGATEDSSWGAIKQLYK